MRDIDFLRRKSRAGKGIYRPGELITWASEGGTPPTPPGPEYLLDATFHRYGPAGPLVLNSGDILDDTGLQAAEIDKGKLTATISTGSATLQNENCDLVAIADLTGEVIPADAGFQYLMEVTGDGTGQVTASLWTAAGQWTAISRKNLTAVDIALDAVTIALSPPSAIRNSMLIVQGGYNTGGEPDPAGTFGYLYFAGTALLFSENMKSVGATTLKPRAETAAVLASVTTMQAYVDPAPLATPHRSLFAVDGPLVDYVPEDGAGWTIVSGTWTIVSGVLNVNTGGSNSVYALYDNPGGGYWEDYVAHTQFNGRLIRVKDEADPGLEMFECRIGTGGGSMQIIEYTGGAQTSRGALAGQSLTDNRVITTDNDNVITLICSGVVLAAAPTTVGNTNTLTGLTMYTLNGPAFAWECARKGTA